MNQMNTLRTKLILLVLSLFVLAVVGCNPEDGDTGPVGPVGSPGATGPKGDTGPPGQDGQDGQDGNANVQAYIFNVAQGDFAVTASQSGTNFRLRHRDTLAVPEITADVMQDGTIQAFFNSDVFSDTSISWTPMPYSDGGVTNNYNYVQGSVNVEVTYVLPPGQGGGPQVFPIGDYTYKIVVIPPASLIQGMNYEDHEMLQAVYGI